MLPSTLLLLVALRRVPIFACLATLLPRVAALHGVAVNAPQTQQLTNVVDVQYYGDIVVGGQPIKGLFDTGSFELVVFGTSCHSCGIAGAYDEKASATFTDGTLSRVHRYGSGSCQSEDGFDTLSIGTLSVQHQAMWLALKCQMDLLSSAGFNAIVGIGPPGQPEFVAKAKLERLHALKRRFNQVGFRLPPFYKQEIAQTEKELEVALNKEDLLESLGVTTFSTCLGQAPGSPGWLVWNDATREGAEGVHKLPVAGNITWGLRLWDMGLHREGGDVIFGCGQGCAAIVDTGTSLFAVPTFIYNKIVDALNGIIENMQISDCSDLTPFPDLVMNLGGQQLRFPPSSYIGSMHGPLNERVAGFIRRERLFARADDCDLLMMDSGQADHTSLGVMVILGMPFFREYYTTFDLGSGRGDRHLFVSKANDNCQPGVGSGVVQSNAIHRAWAGRPRQVDASKLLVPHWLKNWDGLGV